MLKVNENKVKMTTKSLDDRLMDTLFMKTLSRDDAVGYTMAAIVSIGGIGIMLLIAVM